MIRKVVYVCETCNETWDISSFVGYCLECEIELCDNCMEDHSFCKKCAEKITENEREVRFEKDLCL